MQGSENGIPTINELDGYGQTFVTKREVAACSLEESLSFVLSR